MPFTPVDAPPALKHELLGTTAAGVAFLLVMATALAAQENPTFALRWLALALLCWAFVAWQCGRRLHLNQNREDNTVYTTLGNGNRVTLVRGLLIAAAAGFLAVRALDPVLLFVPAILYTAAALGDALDGYLARRQHQVSRLGAELDTALDAMGLLIAPLLAVLYGKLHVSYLLVSIAYYLFQWGIHWRRSHHQPVYALPPSKLRRHLAGWQMGLVATALWPPIPGRITIILGTVFMLPLLFGFCRDWLHVSGRLGSNKEPVA